MLLGVKQLKHVQKNCLSIFHIIRIRYDRITNIIISKKIRVVHIVEKIVDSQCRWFGHVWRRLMVTLVK